MFRNGKYIYFNADTGAGSGGTDPPADGNSAGGNDGGKTPDPITFSAEQQAHIDKLVADRLARAEKATRKKIEDEFTTKAKEAEMTEAEKLKAAKDAAEKEKSDILSKANQRAVTSEAKVIASDLGVKADKLAFVMKLADLTDISVDDSGEPDAKAIRAALEAVKASVPELFGQGGTGKSGGDFTGGNPSKPLTQADID